MTAPAVDPGAIVAPKEGLIGRLQRYTWLGLVAAPIGIAIAGFVAWRIVATADLDPTTERIIATENLTRQLGQHLTITFWSTLIVLLVAIPLGIFLTRENYTKWENPVLTVANSGQALPAYGMIVIFFVWFGRGATTAIIALSVYSLLPVLRNTIVGIQQVDPAIIEAGRGMGMSKGKALRRIELPLAVPVMMAGIRTALVINIGTATLVALIGAGGLGETILSGLNLSREMAIFTGAAMVAVVALTVDWLAAVIYRVVRPRGL